ncbi:hypothetical protein PVAP13_8KG211600 [Panicum virgatum]|uniref:Uncharacterized protein n=1 Tax=Panicum virgatum TaxID=38727 RepID=A0A8T0PMD3_PANVG|nr:hypothetical protein PVAP13_8KG211600 [Panicum virgatum]
MYEKFSILHHQEIDLAAVPTLMKATCIFGSE